jgi:biotin carboxyl carrier protein
LRFRFDVDGQERAVDVERTGGSWVVTLGARRWLAEIRPSGQGWSLLLSPADDSEQRNVARSFDVRIDWPGSDHAEVQVNGVAIALTVTRVLAARRPGAAADGARSDGALRAPMAGRVTRVLVQVGQAVQPRQGLVVVEAMKMENELRVPRGGTVRAIHVAAGDPVNVAEILVELDT